MVTYIDVGDHLPVYNRPSMSPPRGLNDADVALLSQSLVENYQYVIKSSRQKVYLFTVTVIGDTVPVWVKKYEWEPYVCITESRFSEQYGPSGMFVLCPQPYELSQARRMVADIQRSYPTSYLWVSSVVTGYDTTPFTFAFDHQSQHIPQALGSLSENAWGVVKELAKKKTTHEALQFLYSALLYDCTQVLGCRASLEHHPGIDPPNQLLINVNQEASRAPLDFEAGGSAPFKYDKIGTRHRSFHYRINIVSWNTLFKQLEETATQSGTTDLVALFKQEILHVPNAHHIVNFIYVDPRGLRDGGDSQTVFYALYNDLTLANNWYLYIQRRKPEVVDIEAQLRLHIEYIEKFPAPKTNA